MHLLAHLLAASAGLTIILAQSIQQSADGYTYIGCYTDSGDARGLTGNSDTDMVDNEATTCAVFCAGTAYFGLEYRVQCFCGNTIETTSVLTDDSHCEDPDFECPANNAFYCGAGDFMAVYEANPAASSTAPSTATVTATITASCAASTVISATTVTVPSTITVVPSVATVTSSATITASCATSTVISATTITVPSTVTVAPTAISTVTVTVPSTITVVPTSARCATSTAISTTTVTVPSTITVTPSVATVASSNAPYTTVTFIIPSIFTETVVFSTNYQLTISNFKAATTTTATTTTTTTLTGSSSSHTSTSSVTPTSSVKHAKWRRS